MLQHSRRCCYGDVCVNLWDTALWAERPFDVARQLKCKESRGILVLNFFKPFWGAFCGERSTHGHSLPPVRLSECVSSVGCWLWAAECSTNNYMREKSQNDEIKSHEKIKLNLSRHVFWGWKWASIESQYSRKGFCLPTSFFCFLRNLFYVFGEIDIFLVGDENLLVIIPRLVKISYSTFISFDFKDQTAVSR